jgi:hypothetical protein
MMKTFRLALLAAALAAPAAAQEVHFGRNVHIGGHDFSHQNYGPNRHALIYLHNGRPRGEGCRWLPRGAVDQGQRLAARTRVCHFQAR